MRFKCGKGIARALRFSTVAQDDVGQRIATAIVPVGASSSYTPQGTSEELGLHGSIPIALVKIRAEVVTLKIGQNVFHYERIAQGKLQIRVAAAVFNVLV